MLTSLAGPRRRAGIVALLAAALIAGFAAETTSLFDDLWTGLLGVIVPLALLLTAALAASFGKKVRLVTAVVLGVVAGCLTGIMFVLGAFSPFALELGERDLNSLGRDIGWDVSLTWGLIIYGAAGAVLGAACGAAAWALHFGLGRKPLDREPVTREAGR